MKKMITSSKVTASSDAKVNLSVIFDDLENGIQEYLGNDVYSFDPKITGMIDKCYERVDRLFQAYGI